MTISKDKYLAISEVHLDYVHIKPSIFLRLQFWLKEPNVKGKNDFPICCLELNFNNKVA